MSMVVKKVYSFESKLGDKFDLILSSRILGKTIILKHL